MVYFCNASAGIQSILASGADYYTHNQVANVREEQTDNGTIVIAARAIDRFNFVAHPSVTINPETHVILGSSCDCGESRLGICRHGVALLLSLGEKIEVCRHEEQESTVDEESAKEITVRVIHERHNLEQHDDAVALTNHSSNPAVLAESALEKEIRPHPVDEEANELTQTIEKRSEDAMNTSEDEGVSFVPPGIQVRLGTEMRNEEPLEWMPNDTDRLFHTNTGIIGTMGTGKTQLTKSIICQFMRNAKKNYGGGDIGVLIFDYKGDYNETKEDFIRETNAKILKPYRLPYNPLALIPPPTFKPLLPIHTANAFVDILSRSYPLGPKQQQLLLDCIRKAYAKRGIDPNRPETWNRLPPTFAMVHDIFEEETAGRSADSLTAAVNKLYDFRLFDDSHISAGSIRNLMTGVVVIDISGYDQNIQNLVVAITLELFYAQMLTLGSSKTDGRYRQMRQLILVDEADNFMSKNFPALRRIMKEGREFGVGMILSTQSLSHFISGSDNYARYILSWIVHATTDLKQRDVEYLFKLPSNAGKTTALYSTIKTLEKHQSVVKLANDDPVTIQDLPFWMIAAQ